MAGNLPPGVSPSHPYFNPPDHSHEHIFEPDRRNDLTLEDGAGIFHQQCRYVEGEYGEGWQCEETRVDRCDVERVVKIREEKPDITYLASEEDHLNEWGFVERLFEELLIEIERRENRSIEIEQVDPPTDLDDGYVRVRVGMYRVIYKQ